MEIQYNSNRIPSIDELIDLFNNSDYFPIEDKTDVNRISAMFEKASLVVSAWDQELLVGIARSLTDFEYCCYLSDLCVRHGYKGRNIGKSLVQMTKEISGQKCKLILHAAPGALEFYSKIGMQRIDSAFILPRTF